MVILSPLTVFLMIFLVACIFYGIFFLIMLHTFRKEPIEGKYLNIIRISRAAWFFLIGSALFAKWSAINMATLTYDVVVANYRNDMFSGFRVMGTRISLCINVFCLAIFVISSAMMLCGEVIFYRKIRTKYIPADKE